MSSFNHLDAHGNPSMVDVGEKPVTKRTATARSIVVVDDEIMAKFVGEDIHTKKGPVFQTAIIAGVMAAKKTGDLIPLCHPLALTRVTVAFTPDEPVSSITCNATVETVGPTGVEMEALIAVQVALSTIYDMCKAVDRGMTITDVRVLEKHGGKSGNFVKL